MVCVLADLQAKGLVVLGTEFGRRPRINDNDGRDRHDSAHVPAGRGWDR